MHSTHFILRLYGVGHMVKDHSDSERGNLLPPHGLLFLINSKGFFYMHHPTDRIVHTTAFVTPVVKRWLEREIAQWVHPMKDRSDDPSHHERTLLPRSYISLLSFHRVHHFLSLSLDDLQANRVNVFYVPLSYRLTPHSNKHAHYAFLAGLPFHSLSISSPA